MIGLSDCAVTGCVNYNCNITCFGLQEVPSHSVGERRLNIFSLRAFVITSLGHQAILVCV